MAVPDESQSEGTPLWKAQLMYIVKLFLAAANIGFLALLCVVGLLLASVIASTPSRGWWIISFAFAFVALSTHLATWLVLFRRAAGFGASNPLLFWQYWLLVLASGLSIPFAFRGYVRYLAFGALVCELLVSLRFTPVWYLAIRGFGGSSRSARA